MRSTRAAAAVARLNQRCGVSHFSLVITGSGRFRLTAPPERGIDPTEERSLDDFVRYVNALGPQTAPRVTKNDAAFARQLVKKTPS